MKKWTMLLCLVSNLIWTAAFADETAQTQSGENPQMVKCIGMLEKSSDGYFLTTEIGGIGMMINISQKSGEQFGTCAKGVYLLDVNSKEDGGVKILAMDCVNPENAKVPNIVIQITD